MALSHHIRTHFFTRQFVLYSLIGMSGVSVDLFVFFLLNAFLDVPALAATTISVSAGIINNFFLNRKYNFRRGDNVFKRFVSFYCVGAIGILISLFFIVLFQDVFGATATAAKLVSTPVIVIFQFWFNKQFSFAEKGTVPVKPLTTLATCMTGAILLIKML